MKKKDKIILYIFIFIFIINSLLILTKQIDSLDNLVLSFMIGIRSDNLTKIMINITNIGSAYALIVISILLLCLIKNKKISLKIIINLIIVFIISQLLKLFFHRPRPDTIFLVNISDYSYPSGHTMISVAYFGYLLFLLYKYTNSKLIKIILTITTITLLTVISISRIYLGVHYLSDIIGGLSLGIIYLILFINISNKKKVKE